MRVQEVTKQSSNHSSRSQSPPSTTLSPSCSGWPSTSASWMTRSCSWCSLWPTSISRGGLGGPTVEIETDMFGGLHYLHGTHMRGWIFVYMYHLLKHPQCLNAGVTCTKAMAKAMTLVAFLTCGPLVWRRICRNVRAAASLTLLVHITSEATWRRDRKEVSRGERDRGERDNWGKGLISQGTRVSEEPGRKRQREDAYEEKHGGERRESRGINTGSYRVSNEIGGRAAMVAQDSPTQLRL